MYYQAPPKHGLPAWAAALIAGASVFVVMLGVVIILGMNGRGSAEDEAVSACQLQSRVRLAAPGSVTYSDTDYKVTRNYRDDNWEVVGSAVGRDTSGSVRSFSYACVGLYESPDGDWFANSVSNGDA